MRVVNWWQLEVFARDVLPDVHFRPVGNWEYTHVFAFVNARVVNRPEFGALRFRVPLAKIVAEGENAFLRTRFFLVTTRAADAGVKAVLGNGFEQRYGLSGIAAVGIGVAQAHRAFFDGLLHAADDQTFAQFGHALVAKRDHFGEVVSRVHMHDGERQFV